MSDLAAFYHAVKMASVDAIQNMDPCIPMLIAFDEVSYCVEPVKTYTWSRSWGKRSYDPYKKYIHPKREYSPPKIRVEPNYKPHMSLHRRCNSGSGWWKNEM